MLFRSIVPYNATLYNSALITNTFEEEIPKMLRMGKEIDWSMSKNTAYNFLNLVKHLNSNVWRCNSIAIGNEMAFDIPLYYQNASGGIDVEYACPEAFKKVKDHSGYLYLYPNLGHEGTRHNVGTYERIGWNDDVNKPILKMNYDESKIIELLTKWNKLNSNLMTRISQKLVPEMSTEYFCLPKEVDGKILQTNIHNSKGEPIYEGIAIVDYGNCGSEHCEFTMRDNRWITKHGKHIWIDTHYTPEEFYEQFSLKERGKYLTKREYDSINQESELSPWLLIDKNIDISTWGLNTMNRALHGLPLKIKNMIKNIKVYKGGVGEDPYFVGKGDQIPQAYKAVGIDRNWKQTGGVYISSENRAVIGVLKERWGSQLAHTLRHEVGHATWNHISDNDRMEFNSLFRKDEKRVRDIWGDYEANDPSELFAESFARYWDAKTPEEYQRKQRQKIGWVSRFFNTRMQKYFKGE